MNTDVILCIISVCAIFSPVITSAIDNIFKIYLRDKKAESSEKRKVLNEFVNATIECITHSTQNDNDCRPTIDILKRYYKASKTLLVCYPKIDSHKLNILDKQVSSGNKDTIFYYLEDIIDQVTNPIK